MGVAHVQRSVAESGRGVADTLRLCLEGVSERQHFDAVSGLFGPVRHGPLHRIAQHGHEVRLLEFGGGSIGGEGMEQVVRAGLGGERGAHRTFAPTARRRGREVAPVPATRPVEVAVEVVDALHVLAQRKSACRGDERAHRRMSFEVAEQRGRSSAFDPDDDQFRFGPQIGGGHGSSRARPTGRFGVRCRRCRPGPWRRSVSTSRLSDRGTGRCRLHVRRASQRLRQYHGKWPIKLSSSSA